MNKIKTVYSAEKDAKEVSENLAMQLKDFDSKVVIFFASSIYNQEEIAKEMTENFKPAKVIGCSTAGELVTGHMLENSVVVMAFSDEAIADLKIELVQNISQDNGDGIEKAFTSFSNHFNEPMKDMDFTKYVGIILIDGLSMAEERTMDKIGDLTDVIFIGGSAGDDCKFAKTYVYVDGKAYSDAALFVLLKPKGKFDFIKTQSFCALDKELTATKVDTKTRQVVEFDNKPAMQRYAEVLNVQESEVGSLFHTNPVGVLSGSDIFVRSPQGAVGKNIAFYCTILENMKVTLLQSTDIITDTSEAVRAKVEELGPISGIIDFQCILRALELRNNGLTSQYGNIFEGIPMIGFATYGEEFLAHINQTSTMLVFA